MTPFVHRFGRFELDTRERQLSVTGAPVAIGPRAFDVLAILVQRAGKLVSKHELLDGVWSNLVVEENNLQVQISALRKILGPAAIATIPGHGYRFTLDLIHDKAAPAVPATAAKQNLPQQLTSFVGRARELSEIRALLKKTRLLSLVGFGGIGKTRLALQAVAAVTDDYPDGVWFVELASLTDPKLVPQAVASVLGVKEVAGRPVLEALLNHLKDLRLLLILDSCEHLIKDCPEFARQLLQSGPDLRILVTSRERLNLAGETTCTVPPLTMPATDQSITLPALIEYEAVRLFMDRAAAALPTFQLTHQNAVAVVDVCRRVDGIPLAIEMAAARVRALSVEKVAARLSDRFRLLTRGDRTALPHRQTLRALIDWSYELLTEHERALLRRLAVFPGSFTLEAAEAVGAGGDVAAVDVLDLLTELIEKSMVVVEADGERYRLLDTVREYAQERLDESGDEYGARSQHLAFYLAFAEKARPELFRPQQGAWLANLDLERENILSAHAWCERAEGGALLGLRLAYALKPYWFRSGLLGLGHQLTLEALARPEAARRDLARCRALLDAGHLSSFLGRNRDAQTYLENSLAIAQEIGNKDRAGAALRLLGIASFQSGDSATARMYFEEALTLAREVGDKFRLFDALDAMAGFHREQGNLDIAESLYEESLALARERGDLDGTAMTLANLTMVSTGRGAGDRAGTLLEALAIAEKGGSKWAGQLVLSVSAGLAALSGAWRRAAQLYGAAVAQWEHMGVHQDPAEDTFLSPLIARTREALGATAFAGAEAAGRALSYESAIAEARAWLTESRAKHTSDCQLASRNDPAP